MRVLHDLGQASLGANGIAVDARSIAQMLISMPDVDWAGLLTQHDGMSGARLRARPFKRSSETQLMAALFLGSLAGADGDNPEAWLLGRVIGRLDRWLNRFKSDFALAAVPAELRDAVWRSYFQPTLPPANRLDILAQPFFWTDMTHGAVLARSNSPLARSLRLDTSGYDVYLTSEPKPVQTAQTTHVVHRFHDAIPMTAADTMSTSDAIKYHYLLMARCLKSPARRHYVCNSEPTRQELLTMWPDLPAERVSVIPCAVPRTNGPAPSGVSPSYIVKSRLSDMLIEAEKDRFDILERLRANIPAEFPYVLCVAALEPKKNIPGMIRAMELARRTAPELRLVMVGNRGWKSEAIMKAMRPLFTTGHLYHLESLPYQELQVLYSEALCLLFASYAEGFGLPPVEALVAGTPSVCADIPSLRWVMGTSALYADPYDGRAVADQILALRDRDVSRGLIASRSETLDRFCPEFVRDQWGTLLRGLG